MVRGKAIILTFLFLLLSTFHFLNAQEGTNPFDLEHRLEKGEVNRQAPVNAGNPFDIERIETEVVTPEKRTSITPTTSPSKTTKKKKRPQKHSSSFVFWLITIMLIVMTFLLTLYNSIIEKSYRSFINENFLKMVHRDQGRIVSPHYMVFYILFFINLSIFVFLVARHFGWYITASPFWSYMICLGGVIMAFLFKHLLLMLIGAVFPLSKEVRQYSFTIVVFSIILGLALVPFNLLIAFTDPELARVLIYATIALIFGVYAYRAIRGLIIAGSYISLHTFHFFMYLCTAEIAPAVLLAKWVLVQG